MRHAVAMVVVSAATMILEIVAARMLAPLVGMTVYSWTAVIATVLAGLSLGHWIGGRLADGRHDRVARRLFLLLAATAALTPTPILLVEPVFAAASALDLGWMTTTLAVAAACFVLPSLFAGAATPVLTAVAVAEAPGRTGAVIGRMFALGAAGAILGTVLAGFVLLQWIGSIGSLALVAGAEALVAAGYLRGAFPGGRRARVAGAVVLAILGTSALAVHAPPYCRVESRYFCLDEVDTSAWAGFPSRGLFMDGWLQSVEPNDGSSRLAIDAHAVLDAWVRRRHPGDAEWKAFFIGGGGYSLPMRWVDRMPEFRATVAEIDPDVTALAAEIGFRRDHDRVRIHDDDARAVLRDETEAVYDLVFSDAYSGHTMPAHLVSLEFHRLVRGVLEADGVYAINVYDWAATPRFLAALVRTLKRVFPEVTVWASDDGPIRPRGRSHFMVLASAAPLSSAPLAEPAPGDRVWSPLPAVPGLDRAPLLTDDYAPVDRLTQR